MNDQQKRLTIYLADRSPADLTVFRPILFHEKPWIEKDEHCRVEVNPVLLQIAGILPIVPFEAHAGRLYIYVYTKCRPEAIFLGT